MNAKDAWLATLGQLQIQLSRATYDTWLRRADFFAYEDGRFVVSVPSGFARDWIERHLQPSIAQTLGKLLRQPIDFQVIVYDPAAENTDSDETFPLFHYAQRLAEPQGENRGEAIHPDYTFERFVSGSSNHYAYLLAQAAAEGTLNGQGSILLQGAMGVGKTHLLQAITHRAVARGLQVVYLSAEAFTSELIGAIRSNGSGGAAFREKFRTADMVLIDDLQFVEAKDSTQSELVAIWDVLRNRGKTMIFAADRLPCDMAKLSRDARSRFQSGPIAALELPDYALREAIIAAKSAERTVNLPSAVAAILAERLTGSVRDLNSAVDQLATFSTLTKQAVGMADAERVLRVLGVGTSDEVGLSHRGETPTLTAILNATADHFHLSLSDLASRTRTKHIALARQIAMYLAREDGGISLPEIGEALGGRDHSTVVHGCTRAAELVARDAAFARDIADVRARYGRLTATQEPVPVRVKERWRR